MQHPSFKKLWLIGAGGHAKVVISLIHQLGGEVECIYDADEDRHGSMHGGVSVSGPIPEFVSRPGPYGFISIGRNHCRLNIADRLGAGNWATLVHPTAFVAPEATLGEGTVVMAGSIVQPSTTIGRHSIINTGASVDHDCSIGEGVHLCPGVHIAGEVTVGDQALIGTGACVIPGVKIGKNATIGAGAVVIHDVPDGATAVGVPARVVVRT